MTPPSAGPGEVTIRRLETVGPVVDLLVSSGYRSTEYYEVEKHETHQRTTIALTLKPAATPIEVRWPIDDLDREIWRGCAAGGLSLGAYDKTGALVAVCIVEKRKWNHTLWVWDLHVSPAYRGRGIGRRLLDETIRTARREGCRVVALETQTTNVPAITFYRKAGFEIDGIDLSYYRNDDAGGGGQVCVFMKHKLTAETQSEI